MAALLQSAMRNSFLVEILLPDLPYVGQTDCYKIGIQWQLFFWSRDDEHPELAPVPAGDARVAVEVRHLELAAPGVGRRPQVVGDPRHLQRRQLRQAPLRLHRRLLEIDLDPRRPCSIVVSSEFREDRADQRMASWPRLT